MAGRSSAFAAAAVAVFAANPAHARNANAIADNVIAVHGITPGRGSHPDDEAWVRNNYFVNGFLNQICGNGARCQSAAVVAYDGINEGWDHHEFASPGCYIARKAFSIPGVNIAIVGHSMGGIAAAHLVHDVVNGFAGGWNCGVDITQAVGWIGNLHSIGSPFNGSPAAEAVWNPLSCINYIACQTVGFITLGPILGNLVSFAVGALGRVTSVYAVRPVVAGQKFKAWVSNIGSYTNFMSIGLNAGWLEPLAACTCVGGTHDGVVESGSGIAAGQSKSGSQWLGGAAQGVNHEDEKNGTTRGNGTYANTSMASAVWRHDFY